ncbi:hypothetical protein NITHO_4920006 [Nitrolancea hollandica Lb]|uniref:Uncharacterized protein n=2 Tax=Nitrolancea hollandica TaxID=1206749 RepID=I4EL33_9BACT|nr:hypothetical protein NITHO_4920006 [Nitrolancea hollandica Lb]
MGMKPFTGPPVAIPIDQLREELKKNEGPWSEKLNGYFAGLLALSAQRDQPGLLKTILKSEGTLYLTPDGIWQVHEGSAARIHRYPTLDERKVS